MKLDFTSLNLAAAMTIILMVAVSFWSFFQTSIGQTIIIYIYNSLMIVPYLASLSQLIIPLWFLLFELIAFLIYFIKPQKIKWLEFLVFLPLIPAILPFSTSSWFWQLPSLLGLPIRMPTLPQDLSFIQIAIIGVAIFSCTITLKFISNTKNTRKELLSRGGDSLEVTRTITGSFSYLLIILIISAGLSVAAALAVIFAQPLGTMLIQTTPYATLVLGVGFLTFLCALVYYYLVQKRYG